MLYGTGKYTYELVEPWAKLDVVDSFINVVSVSVDSEDRVWVFNRSKRPMILFNQDGKELGSWGEDICSKPHGSFLSSDDHIYVTDNFHHIAQKYTRQGDLVMTLGIKDQPSDTGYHPGLDIWEGLSSIKKVAGPFNQPTGIAVSLKGEIFVTDGYGNAQVHKFSPNGKLLLSWGESGGRPGQFRTPHNIWIDKHDNLWVSDRENNRIQIFDDKGKLLDVWTDILRPTQVVIDTEDTVYISEMCRRISIFAIDGKLLTRWGNESHRSDNPLFVAPHTIGIDSKGDMYVGDCVVAGGFADRRAGAIRKFARRG